MGCCISQAPTRYSILLLTTSNILTRYFHNTVIINFVGLLITFYIPSYHPEKDIPETKILIR